MHTNKKMFPDRDIHLNSNFLIGYPKSPIKTDTTNKNPQNLSPPRISAEYSKIPLNRVSGPIISRGRIVNYQGQPLYTGESGNGNDTIPDENQYRPETHVPLSDQSNQPVISMIDKNQIINIPSAQNLQHISQYDLKEIPAQNEPKEIPELNNPSEIHEQNKPLEIPEQKNFDKNNEKIVDPPEKNNDLLKIQENSIPNELPSMPQPIQKSFQTIVRSKEDEWELLVKHKQKLAQLEKEQEDKEKRDKQLKYKEELLEQIERNKARSICENYAKRQLLSRIKKQQEEFDIALKLKKEEEKQLKEMTRKYYERQMNERENGGNELKFHTSRSKVHNLTSDNPLIINSGEEQMYRKVCFLYLI